MFQVVFGDLIGTGRSAGKRRKEEKISGSFVFLITTT